MPRESHRSLEWLAYAREDLAIAQTEHCDNPYARGLRAFHCQQAAEKALKAVVELDNPAAPRTHNLTSLLNAVTIATIPSGIQDAKQLTVYPAAARYPDEILNVSESDLTEAIELARTLLEWATHIVSTN